MKDKYKIEGQRLEEFAKLRYRTAELEKAEAKRKRAGEAPKLRRYKVKRRR